ncbi:MAG: hypothetical protein ACRCZP_14720 [Phycicoccus sp.]
MSEPTVRLDAGADVRAYVIAVRGWLADLPREDVDDLTTGMEADLAERAAETGARLGDLLGEPEVYATELRAAAGLPPRAAVTDVDSVEFPRESWAVRMRGAGDDVLHRWPWLRELRPTWWLVRGAVLGALVMMVLDASRPVGWLLPLTGAGLSFAWSRRHLGGTAAGWRRRGLVAANAAAVLVTLPVTIALLSAQTEYVETAGGGEYVPPGLVMDGESVTNVYAYAADGTRLDGIRLYDTQGRTLMVDPGMISPPETTVDGELAPGPNPDPSVFPLRSGPGGDHWVPIDGEWSPPVAIAPLIPEPEPTASPSATSPAPTPSASPGPTASSPSPTASPSPTGAPSSSGSPSPTVSPSPTASGTP